MLHNINGAGDYCKMLKWLFIYTFYEETEHYSETNANEIYNLYLKDN